MDDSEKIQLTAFNLKNPTKLLVIQFLSNKEASNQEIYDALKSTLAIKYRSAIYGALKDLQEIGLIEKYYDNSDSKIKYRLIVKNVNIDLEKLKIFFTP
jgi:DNA-binding PadR family transcriptional regulator